MQAFLHAQEPQPLSEIRGIGIESFALVRNTKPHRAGGFIQLNECAPCPTVLLHVADRFLSYPEKAQGRILWWFLVWTGVHEYNLHAIARREIPAKVGQRGGQS